jgi:hypothetical protein
MFQFLEVVTGKVFFFFLQDLLFTVYIIVYLDNQADFDSDEEYKSTRSGMWQPLVNQQAATDPKLPNLSYHPIWNGELFQYSAW